MSTKHEALITFSSAALTTINKRNAARTKCILYCAFLLFLGLYNCFALATPKVLQMAYKYDDTMPIDAFLADLKVQGADQLRRTFNEEWIETVGDLRLVFAEQMPILLSVPHKKLLHAALNEQNGLLSLVFPFSFRSPFVVLRSSPPRSLLLSNLQIRFQCYSGIP